MKFQCVTTNQVELRRKNQTRAKQVSGTTPAASLASLLRCSAQAHHHLCGQPQSAASWQSVNNDKVAK